MEKVKGDKTSVAKKEVEEEGRQWEDKGKSGKT